MFFVATIFSVAKAIITPNWIDRSNTWL